MKGGGQYGRASLPTPDLSQSLSLYRAEGANQRVAKVRKPKQNAPRLYAESWGV